MRFSKAQTRFFANFFTNLAAGFVGVIFLAPNFGNLSEPKNFFILIFDIGFAILFSALAIRLEEKLK